jgi:pyridoxine 5-phosphate synthase
MQGMDLTKESIVPLLELALIEEYNIGHWIIAEAIFDGISGSVVSNLKNLISRYPLRNP